MTDFKILGGKSVFEWMFEQSTVMSKNLGKSITRLPVV